MVIKRILPAFFLAASLAVAVACSDSKDSKASTSPTRAPAAQATSAPSGKPQASIDPKAAPPGNQVIVSGSGFPALTPVTIIAESAPTLAPYARVTTDSSGSFTAQFRLEKAPDGSDLKTGRFGLIARGGDASVVIPFLVETARPVRNPGGG